MSFLIFLIMFLNYQNLSKKIGIPFFFFSLIVGIAYAT